MEGYCCHNPIKYTCRLHWFIGKNDFPYDLIASKHDLLVPFRVFADADDMGNAERSELAQIKARLAKTKEYDTVMENIPHSRTVKGHYHLHLLKFRELTDFNHG